MSLHEAHGTVTPKKARAMTTNENARHPHGAIGSANGPSRPALAVTGLEDGGSISGSAMISECGLYRYTLTRQWADGKRCVFIMLNPSTADASEDDPTIRRCIGFAKREGCGSLTVVNLFAFRATKPDDMFAADDPVGPENVHHLWHEATQADLLIAAWGAHAKSRAATVKWELRTFPMFALGLNKNGSPQHPLYIKADAPLIPFNDAARAAQSKLFDGSNTHA